MRCRAMAKSTSATSPAAIRMSSACRSPKLATCSRARAIPLPEWLYEEGIGENRAILVEADLILEAAIELPGELRAAAVVRGRLREIVMPQRRGWIESDGADIL